MTAAVCRACAVWVACAAMVGAAGATPTPAERPQRPASVRFIGADGAAAPVVVEVVSRPLQTQVGLMFRLFMPPGMGMLFIMPQTRRQSFWMRNTMIPLDMIFVDDSRVVVGIVRHAQPLTLTARAVDAPSRFVIEVAGGYAAEAGIAVGDRVVFERVFGR